MAAARKKQQRERPKYSCRDCIHSYDWHEKNWRGKLFMCRCPHYKEGKFSKLLDDPQCNVFELRNNGTVGQMGE